MLNKFHTNQDVKSVQNYSFRGFGPQKLKKNSFKTRVVFVYFQFIIFVGSLKIFLRFGAKHLTFDPDIEKNQINEIGCWYFFRTIKVICSNILFEI